MVRGILTQHVMEVVSSEAMSGQNAEALMAESLRDVRSSRGMNPADQSALITMLQGVGKALVVTLAAFCLLTQVSAVDHAVDRISDRGQLASMGK